MRGRTFATTGLALAALVILAILIAWAMRFRIATGLVDHKLADASVSASYKLTKIGPLHEQLENVRIGDPKAPDLVARRIDVALGYSWSGLTVRAIRVDGVQLRATLNRNGLSLGSIDRLMPKSRSGATKLPDLRVSLRDVQLALATPNGTMRVALAGTGNPQTAFRGTAHVEAPALRLASCALTGVGADLKIAAIGGKPHAAGPVRIASSSCPGMILGKGEVDLALSSDRIFEQITLQAKLAGLGGKVGPARFASVNGPIEATGTIGNLKAQAKLAFRSLSLPDTARRIARSGPMLAGTPIEPTGRRATQALAALLTQSDASADLTASIQGTSADIHATRLGLARRDGAHLTATEHGGMRWTAQGWRADGDVAMGGGGLPEMTVQLRQAAPGAPLTGVVQSAAYRAGDARLAVSPLHFAWNGGRMTFDTIVQIDGPISSGFVRGLTLPVRGMATAAGTVVVDQGCQSVSFQQLRLTNFIFDNARLSICGQPIMARTGGAVRIDAGSGPVRLTGHTSDGAPVALSAARLRLTQNGFTATDTGAALGPADRQTHFAIAALDGEFRSGGVTGKFAGASGGIANVPLNIADASGGWSFAGGLLRLRGDLRVSDASVAARFNPLSTADAQLDLNGGVIRATATLREPASRAEVVRVSVDHDLSSGSGHALLNVKGIVFAPKGLQPETLTPLTLGVVANVAGLVSGNGRIDWSPKGVTSSGTFGTDKIDLAAAFGPVTGIKGQAHFTDLLGLVTAPNQEAMVAEVNPGVQVADGVVHYQLIGQNRVKVQDATWPFAGGTLRLEPTTLDFGAEAERRLTFHIEGLDAAAFVQQLDFPNIAATGTFDGVLPMIFDQAGGRIEAGKIVARKDGGTLAYVGELSNAQLGTMGKLAFDALKAIHYSSLDISLDGRLDGEMVSRVRFTGVREATPEKSLVTRLIRNLPFRFNIQIRAPFRGLVGSARAYIDPRLLLNQVQPTPPSPPAKATTPAEPAIQTKESGHPL